jgi:hypothetical protein
VFGQRGGVPGRVVECALALPAFRYPSSAWHLRDRALCAHVRCALQLFIGLATSRQLLNANAQAAHGRAFS